MKQNPKNPNLADNEAENDEDSPSEDGAKANSVSKGTKKKPKAVHQQHVQFRRSNDRSDQWSIGRSLEDLQYSGPIYHDRKLSYTDCHTFTEFIEHVGICICNQQHAPIFFPTDKHID